MNSILFVCGHKLGMFISNKIMSMLNKDVSDSFTLEIKDIQQGKILFYETVMFVEEHHDNSTTKRTYRKINRALHDGLNPENVLNTYLNHDMQDDIHHASVVVNNHESKLIIDIYSPANSKYEHLKNLLLYDGKPLDQTITVNEKWSNRILELPEWVQI